MVAPATASVHQDVSSVLTLGSVPAGDQQWQRREGPASRDPAPEPTAPENIAKIDVKEHTTYVFL